jgi:hypothetical protein
MDEWLVHTHHGWLPGTGLCGVNSVGQYFLVTHAFYLLGLRLTKSYPPIKGGIKLAAPGANTENSTNHLHFHAEHGNE